MTIRPFKDYISPNSLISGYCNVWSLIIGIYSSYNTRYGFKSLRLVVHEPYPEN